LDNLHKTALEILWSVLKVEQPKSDYIVGTILIVGVHPGKTGIESRQRSGETVYERIVETAIVSADTLKHPGGLIRSITLRLAGGGEILLDPDPEIKTTANNPLTASDPPHFKEGSTIKECTIIRSFQP